MSRLTAPVSAIFLTFALIVSAQAAPPVAAFGQLPAIDDVKVSPDGRHLAMLQSVQGKKVAVIYKVGAPAGTKPAALNMQEGDVRSIFWASNDRLLVWLSSTQYMPNDKWKRTFEFYRLASVNTAAQGLVFLFPGRNFRYMTTSGLTVSLLPGDPDHVLIANREVRFTDTGGMGPDIGGGRSDPFSGLNVYKVNVHTGREDRIERGGAHTVDYLAAADGTLRVRIDVKINKDGRHDVAIFANGPGGGRLERLASYDSNFPVREPGFFGFGSDPNKIHVAGFKGSDRQGLHVYDLTSKSVTQTKFLHDRYDMWSIVTDDHTGEVVGIRYIEHFFRTVFFNKTLAGLQKALEGAFKGQSVRLTSWSRDRNLVALFVEGPGNPGGYFLFDARTKQASPLAAIYPSLQGQKLGRTQPVSYKARDGLTIPAYLTLPPDRAARNLPLVVLPHGGPELRDNQSFDWWAGFYASRGYAVLQPNFRGSYGYGENFVRAGYGEFGGKMQDDLTDGVKHLTAQGIADPKRVCIVGGSYGGYAALAGAAFTPNVYACAVSVNGVADLNEMMSYTVRQRGMRTDTFSLQYWEQWLGRRIGDQDRMAAASPAKHAGQVKAPVLLIHGRADTIVPFEHSELMANALKAAGKPHKLIALEGEDHWLSEARSRIRVLKETEAFLKEHIGN